MMNNMTAPEPFREDGGLLPVAIFARRHAPLIAEFCTTTDPSEAARLMDAGYTATTFALSNVSFFRDTTTLIKGTDADSRYGKSAADHHTLGTFAVRLTSQWFRKQYAPFVGYLVQHDLLDSEVAARIHHLLEQAHTSIKKSGAMKKSYPIGNAQNLAIRTVLDRTAPGPLMSEWIDTLDEFGHACAYCQTRFDENTTIEVEHIVGVNQAALGEHVIGNVIPACKACNSAKLKTDFRAWIAMTPRISNRTATLERIEAHMARYEYTPLGDLLPSGDARLTAAFAELRLDLNAAADRCAAIIRALRESSEGSSRDL